MGINLKSTSETTEWHGMKLITSLSELKSNSPVTMAVAMNNKGDKKLAAMHIAARGPRRINGGSGCLPSDLTEDDPIVPSNRCSLADIVGEEGRITVSAGEGGNVWRNDTLKSQAEPFGPVDYRIENGKIVPRHNGATNLGSIDPDTTFSLNGFPAYKFQFAGKNGRFSSHLFQADQEMERKSVQAKPPFVGMSEVTVTDGGISFGPFELVERGSGKVKHSADMHQVDVGVEVRDIDVQSVHVCQAARLPEGLVLVDETTVSSDTVNEPIIQFSQRLRAELQTPQAPVFELAAGIPIGQLAEGGVEGMHSTYGTTAYHRGQVMSHTPLKSGENPLTVVRRILENRDPSLGGKVDNHPLPGSILTLLVKAYPTKEPLPNVDIRMDRSRALTPTEVNDFVRQNLPINPESAIGQLDQLQEQVLPTYKWEPEAWTITGGVVKKSLDAVYVGIPGTGFHREAMQDARILQPNVSGTYQLTEAIGVKISGSQIDIEQRTLEGTQTTSIRNGRQGLVVKETGVIAKIDFETGQTEERERVSHFGPKGFKETYTVNGQKNTVRTLEPAKFAVAQKPV